MKQSLGAHPLIMPTPVWAIGTYDAEGKPNVMTAAWGGICCSKPFCVGVALRAATYSHGNIMARKAFTISVPSAAQVDQADYFGVVSGREADKFKVAGLTPVRSELVDAPYVGEFPMVAECKVIQVSELGLHTHFIAEVLDVKVDSSAMGEKHADMSKVSPILFSPGDRNYYGLGEVVGHGFSSGGVLAKQD